MENMTDSTPLIFANSFCFSIMYTKMDIMYFQSSFKDDIFF